MQFNFVFLEKMGKDSEHRTFSERTKKEKLKTEVKQKCAVWE